ncbi:MAG: hypothetical protein JNK04_03435, partial [Myxococcales bacterium]|nr:hypothetical protein [Myxococcales bacterium]
MTMRRASWAAAVSSIAVVSACLTPVTAPRDAIAPLPPQVVVPPSQGVAPSAVPSVSPPAWSREDARSFLASRVDEWISDVPHVGNNFACATTCHTSLPWALSASADGLQSPTGKRLFESVAARVGGANDFRGATPYYGRAQAAEGRRSLSSEAAVNAWIANEGGGLDQAAKNRANAHLWRMQRGDGGFDWMSYGLAPWEDGDELIAAAFAGRAASVAPDGIDEQRQKLGAFFRSKVGSARLFSLAFAVWALRDWPEAWAPGQRTATLASIRGRALASGAWSW